MSFNTLGLSNALLKAISEKGYTTPSPIQEKAIPHVLQGKDILASAQTGTGKTAGFILPILELLSKKEQKGKRPIRALVLTPTRELAAQIYDNAREYGKYLNMKSTVIFGGVNANPQIRTLRQGVDILIATPGRLLDLESQRALSLSKIDVLVLDEADRMLDMGFARDINRIMALLPKRRQNLLFSATFSKEIKQLAGKFLYNPVTVNTAPENSTADKVNQTIYRVDKKRKAGLVIKLISEGDWSQVLIFTRTKHGANRLSEKLSKKQISSAAIHGNKSQNARTKALAGFKNGTIRVLVATDIAARGLDIPLLPHVINYELPNVAEDYVHRIGRTGRAGASGEAISLVDAHELSYVVSIEKLLKIKLPYQTVEGFEPLENVENKVLPPIKKKPFQRPKKKQEQGNNKKDFKKERKKQPNKKKRLY